MVLAGMSVGDRSRTKTSAPASITASRSSAVLTAFVPSNTPLTKGSAWPRHGVMLNTRDRIRHLVRVSFLAVGNEFALTEHSLQED